MSATSQLTTFSDLYTDLQNRVRVQTGVSATENQAKRYINIANHDIYIGFAEAMPWAERQATLTTHPDYNTGTLTATQGSTTITGSGTAWNTNNALGEANMRAGGKIVIDGGKEVYEISAVASDTSATLTTAFIKATAAGASYSYFEDEYSLHADFLRPVSVTSFDINGEIELISRTLFRSRYPRNKTVNKPIIATLVDGSFGSNTTPVRKVRFAPPPDDAYLYDYAFITNKLAVDASGTELTDLSADTDEPIIPAAYRHAIVFHALYHWYRDKKDDVRQAAARAEYQDLITRVVSDQEIGRARPQFQPRLGQYVSKAKTPFRGGRARRFVVGSRFDEFR